MGLIGLLVTVVIMVIGAGYMLWGAPDSALVVNNQSVTSSLDASKRAISTDANAPVSGDTLSGRARELKAKIEQQAADTMAEGEKDNPTVVPKTNAPTKKKSSLTIVDTAVSFGFSVPSIARTIDTIVVHSSYDLNGNEKYSVSGTIKEYAEYGVSPHYLIDRQGTIYRLVDDANIAYHAGESQMPDGRTNVNTFSIGVEMLNTEEDQYTDTQYESMKNLIAYLKERYPIKFVVGHNDIAPGRKTDPWNFDWKKLK